MESSSEKQEQRPYTRDICEYWNDVAQNCSVVAGRVDRRVDCKGNKLACPTIYDAAEG